VDVDLAHIETPVPLLRFNEGDNDVEEMLVSSWETMDFISPEQPPDRIHLFVKLTDREYDPYFFAITAATF
jgi:hypothetical protein